MDDDNDVVDALRVLLEHHGYLVSTAGTGSEAIRRALAEAPNLILLDVMLPDLDGFEILARLEAETDIPIIMLTARTQTKDMVRGMDGGAIYYIRKPFNNDELLAHIRRALKENPRDRARRASRGAVYPVDGDLTIDFGAARLRIHGHPVSLTPTELRILRRLVDGQGKVVSNPELMQAVWGEEHAADVRVVKVHIRALREKLGESAKDPRYIHNVRGLGYLFEPRP